MEKLFTYELMEREKYLLDDGGEEILKEFEMKGEEMQLADAQGTMKPANWLREGFFYGVVTTLSIVFVSISVILSPKFFSSWGEIGHFIFHEHTVQLYISFYQLVGFVAYFSNRKFCFHVFFSMLCTDCSVNIKLG